MRIALFSEDIFPLKIGGIQKHSYLFAKYLAKRSVYTDIYFYTSENDATAKISSYYTPKELTFLRFFPIPSPSTPYFPGHFIYFSWLASKKLCAAFLESKQTYDLVYIQGFSGWALLNQQQSHKELPTTFINFHGLEMFQKPANLKSALENLLFRPFVKSCLRNADYLISLGGKLTKILDTEGADQGKTLEVPIGISEDWLLTKGYEKEVSIRKFVFIGRYERRKGIEELNQVLKSLSLDQNFQFDFIGPIPEDRKIESPRIIYHGLIKDGEKIKAILRASDMLVCPSWSEGMPTVILEAMASGCAIIATDVGAVSCLVSEKNGWLLEAGDVGGLKRAIEEGIAMKVYSLQEKQANSVRLVQEKYTWDTVITHFLASVQPLLKA